MNDLKIPPITPKRVLLGILALVIFVYVYSSVSAVMQNSQGFHSERGMSGTVTQRGSALASLPSEKTLGMMSPPMMDSGEAYGAPGISAVNEADMMIPQPSVPSQTPPSGVSKIVKSGDLTLLVKDVEDTATQITAIRTQMGGQPGNATFNEYRPGMRSGDITIWVPSDRFDEAMLAIKKLALRVENESIRANDVSAQYVDLTAHLKVRRAAEAQLIELMKRAGTINEVLNVTNQLNSTRTEIEQLQGQLDYLAHQVALSSIHINLAQEAVPSTVANEWRPLTVLKEASKETLNDLTNFADTLIVFIVKLPALLLNIALWVFIFWLFWKIGLVVCRNLYRIFSSALSKEKV